MTRSSTLRHPLSRRRFVGTGLAASAAASATFAAPAVLRARQDGDVSGELVEWGFGIQETNPLARARVLAFQEAYPDVDLQIVESFDEQKLLTAAASDTLPDVIWLSRAETATWASRGVLRPLTEFIDRDNYDTSAFYPFAIDETTWEGEVYGIPGGADVQALFVNLDHLEEIGVNIDEVDTSDWDQLSELGAQLTKVSGDQVERWGLDHKVQAGSLWLWAYGNGGKFLSDDGTEATFDMAENVEALQWAIDAYEAQGGFQMYESFATTFQGDQQFAQGLVSMSIYQQWMLSAAIATVAPDMNFRFIPIRHRGSGPDGPISTYSGGNGWYITSGAQNPEAAWEYIKFMHTDETWHIGARAVKELREEQGNPYFPSLTGKPSVDQWQIDELYEPVGPAFDQAVELMPKLLEESRQRELYLSPVGGQLEDILNQDGVRPALSGSMSAEDSLSDADQLAQDAIDGF